MEQRPMQPAMTRNRPVEITPTRSSLRPIGPALLALAVTLAASGQAVAQAGRVEFTRMVAHWDGYADPGYLQFVDDARPQVAQEQQMPPEHRQRFRIPTLDAADRCPP